MTYWTKYCPQCGSELIETTGGVYCIACGWYTNEDYWEVDVEANE